MSKVRYNTVADALQGRVGVLVFRRVRGKLRVSNRPNESSKPPSASQLAQRVVFARAIAKARDMLSNEDMRLMYERVAAAKQTTAFAAAMGDYFHPPEVPDMEMDGFTGAIGSMIKIRATDDVQVKSVYVIVRKTDGTVLEQGAAVASGSYWYYTCTTAIPAGTFLTIEAAAKDWMGNEGKKNLNYP
jgi:hypothetical protein